MSQFSCRAKAAGQDDFENIAAVRSGRGFQNRKHTGVGIRTPFGELGTP